MDVLLDRSAGPDLHKKTVVACLRRVDAVGCVYVRSRIFPTTTTDLIELADWLAAEGVAHVAMESTGVFLVPVRQLLEGRFELTPINPRHMPQVPGRKTDVKDAE